MAKSNGDTPRELFLIDGNSLAYRAFFALPESIATSDGRPTNAIFGFASMLVKILTDYGEVPTVVVWDAGMSGRKEISADYKAQRSSRPDLLKQQWPHLRPLVEAFGYRNISVEGYEADDVIAALVRQAQERQIPVMVVTGDRDAYQLVGDGVRIMTTSRGITDTKVYDREGVIDRYGIPPELIPDFIGLKGDTSDNIPGVPGIGDKTASELLQRFGDLETVLASVDEISGAKRKQNLTEHAEDARALQAARHDRLRRPGRPRPRGRGHPPPRPRRPARDVPRVGAARPAAPPRGGARAARRRGDPAPRAAGRQDRSPSAEGRPADIDMLGGEPLALVALAPEIAEGELIPREEHWRFGAYAGGCHALVGEFDDPAELVAAAEDRPVVAHDAKALGDVPPNLVFDTEIAAYLLDPARRGYPLDELCEERGLAVNAEDEQGARAVLVHTLAEQQAAQLHERGLVDLLTDIELPLVHVLRECEKQGIKLDTAEARDGRVPHPRRRRPARARDLGGRRRGVRDRLARSSSARSCSRSSACRASAAARPASPPTRACCRRSATSTRSSPRSSASGSSPSSSRPTSTRCPPGSATTAACTRRSCRSPPPPAGSPPSTRTSRTSRSAPRPAARSARCFIAEPGNCLISSTTPRSSCGSSPTSPTRTCCATSSCAARTCTPRPPPPSSTPPPSSSRSACARKAKMVNYGIVYGLSAYGLADRLQIEQEEAQEFIDRYLERFPAVAQFMADAVTQAEEHGYVSHAVRPPPPDPRDPRAQLADAQARRAARGQLGHPGHRGRHHQGRDGPLPRRAARRRACRPAASCRSTTSCCSRARPRRPSGRPRSCAPRWSPPPTSTRRWPSSRASARTGWTRSSGPRRSQSCSPPSSAACSPLQGPINSTLGKTIGNSQAAFFSFLTGTIILAVIAGLVQRRLRPDRGGQVARAAVPDRRRARRVLRLDRPRDRAHARRGRDRRRHDRRAS